MTEDQAQRIVNLLKDIIRNETQDAGESGAGYRWEADAELQDLLVEVTRNDSTRNQ